MRTEDDLEIVGPGADSAFPFGPDPQRPHPLGTRDVLEVLTYWGKMILVAVAVVVTLLITYRLGEDSQHLVILPSPLAEGGIAWRCNGNLVLVARFLEVPQGPVSVRIEGKDPAVPLQVLDGEAFAAGHYAADNGGVLEVYSAGRLPVPTVSRLHVAAVPMNAPADMREVLLAVLPCGKSAP
jgi:hypothetical protein